MIKRIVPIFLLVTMCMVAMYSCKKRTIDTTDQTRNYFPLHYGKYITYDVDSVYYYGSKSTISPGTRWESHCQLKYLVSDTFTDSKNRLSYILDIYYRPYDGSDWTRSRVIIITPTANSLLYTQDQTQYIKLAFPITEGYTWTGNQYAEVQDTLFSYLKNWNYTYQNYHLSYFNGRVNFDNTVTCLENDENVNYQNVDSIVAGYRTYAKEVYAYNVGMIYKEWTHYTWGLPDTTQNRNGYSVIMRAIDHN